MMINTMMEYNDEDGDEDDEEDLEEVDGSEAERCAHTERLKSRHQLNMKMIIILLVMMATGMITMVIMTMVMIPENRWRTIFKLLVEPTKTPTEILVWVKWVPQMLDVF